MNTILIAWSFYLLRFCGLRLGFNRSRSPAKHKYNLLLRRPNIIPCSSRHCLSVAHMMVNLRVSPIEFYFIKLNKQEPKPTNNVIFYLLTIFIAWIFQCFKHRRLSAVATALVSWTIIICIKSPSAFFLYFFSII